MKKPFEVGKSYKDGLNRNIRIVAINALGMYPVVGLVTKCGQEEPETYTLSGSYASGTTSSKDLIPEKNEKTIFVNVYRNGTVYKHDTAESARQGALDDSGKVGPSVALVAHPITFEV